MNVLSEINNKDKFIRPVYVSFLFALIVGIGVIVSGTSNTMFLLAIFIFLANVFCSFEQRNSRILALLLLITAYILMVATNNNSGANGDYRAYHGLYEHFSYGGSISNITGYRAEYGYMVLMLAVSKLGISYNMFLAVLAAVSITLIHSTVSKITTNYNLVLSCYMLSPFFYDVFQFRYFFAYSIVVFALKYILFENKKNYLKYAALVIISSFFHTATLFFLLYLVLKLNVRLFIKLALLVSVFVTVANFVMKKNMVDIIYSFINFSKLEYYTSGTIKYQLNSFTPVMIILVILYFVFIAKSIYDKDPSFTNRQILWVNLLNILIFPLLLVSLDFERFLRPILLINYALIAEHNKRLFGSKRNLILISLLVVVGLRQYFMNDVTNIILENNYIFAYFNNLF
ncbi:EpsG family protein [Paenibacillus jilunlii]|uniref:EpsG family protein n=1 Tax=Paenibacillus jilunlii TaxID=682956 RepID=A0A1G9ZZG5_9BACL|nr:EpsG family protein [Paenibacillus jilunlii]KWX79917.1 hypothetical protein AML91_01745 [Paenibacillus jilunlii]SDN26281.1 EpsG family protein [Paenibacillus jilunlii]